MAIAMRFPLLLLQFVVLGLAIQLDAGYPLKILGLFPHQGLSHFHFFHPIMRGLAERGHHVTVISPFPDKSPPAHYRDLPLQNISILTNTVDLNSFNNRRFYTHFVEFFLIHEWGKEACNYTLRSDALAQVLQERIRYDVIILEQFNTDCMMGVAHQLKAPVIALSSCALMPWHYDRFGLPLIPSVTPAVFLGQSEEMNFGGRIANWITFHGMRLLYDIFSTRAADALVRYKFGQDTPSVAELAKDTSIIFTNQHFSLSGAKTLPPSVIELGGIHIQNAKPLDIELRRFLDNAEHGVIFISWGSMIRADSLPPAKREGFLRAVKRLKQRIVWKWEDDTLNNKSENLYVSKWLPQRDILCHPNVNLFMTHAGLMGTTEAIYCGVPMIATPMYGDQFLNAAALQHRGMGLILQFEDINENTVIKSIREALKKPYADTAKIVSQSFKQRPQTAMETAIWWVEYVAKTEGAPLTKSTAVYMSRFIYYSLDVYLFLGIILALFVLSWIWIFGRLCARWCRTEKLKKN